VWKIFKKAAKKTLIFVELDDLLSYSFDFEEIDYNIC